MINKVKSGMRAKWNKILDRYQMWRAHNFIPSSKFLYWVALILIAMAVAAEVGRIMVPEWIGYAIVMIICILIGIVARAIIGWVATLFLRGSIEELISGLMILFVTVGGVGYLAFRMDRIEIVVIGSIIGLFLILFLKSLWSFIVGKLYTKFNGCVVIVGVLLIGMGVYFLNSKGFEDTYIKTYLHLEKNAPVLTEAESRKFQSSVQGGEYTVLTATYDLSDADITSKTVNLTSYAQNKGFAGYVKEKYQGYGLNKVPLRGKIWYPRELKNCPTLFIIHGNHDYIEESYLGYEYLGQYLASYGYVMVSVDQNACNLLTNENDARAILLLENIKAVQKYNAQKDNPIYQKIDTQNIAIAGHSRGGEAVSIAYLFNDEEVNPNNGKIKLDYHFNIKSIIAIAPTIDQYQPTSKAVELEDVNYLIIHGANDQDLYDFGGIKQYKDIHFTGEGDYIKTSLYCAGCNHGQFNSRWGLYDRTGFYSKALNVENFVSEQEQQRIAEIFIKTFLDCTLKGNRTYISLFEDYRKYRENIPQTLYVQSYQTSDFNVIGNFEEDTILTTGTMKGVELDVEGGSVWTEGLYPTEAANGNSSAYIQWNNNKTPTLKIDTPVLDVKGHILQFDVMNLEEGFKEKEVEEGKIGLLQGSIILEDTMGNQSTIRLADVATIYPAFLVRLTKLQYLSDSIEYKHQFQTVTIPIGLFESENSELDTSQITGIRITFEGETGTVAIDEIGYR